MADIFSGRGSRQFPSFPKPRFGNPVPARRGVNRGARRQSGSAFDRFPSDSFEDIFGTGAFSFNTAETNFRPNIQEENTSEEFRRGLFQDDPGLAFETSLSQSGLNRNMVDVFRQNASGFLADFQGALGRQLLATGQGDLNPLDFFQNLDFNQEFQRFSPQERGANRA